MEVAVIRIIPDKINSWGLGDDERAT